MTRHRHAVLPAAALLAAFAAGPVAAQTTLRIAAMTSPSALDPHYHSTNNNNMALQQIFSTLVEEANSGELLPNLAQSWRVVDDLTWEFKLRPGVRFHDGTPFEAEDIAFTIGRIPHVPNSPGPFTPYARSVKSIEIVDPLTVRFHTHQPNPFLDYDLTRVLLLSRKIHAEATTSEFTSGRLAIGTGAYRYQSFVLNERLTLEANRDFFGRKPA
jgi:peptide/nickel transport system substrate-binding protein